MTHREYGLVRAPRTQRSAWQQEIRRVNRLEGTPAGSWRQRNPEPVTWFIDQRSIFTQLAKIDT